MVAKTDNFSGILQANPLRTRMIKNLIKQHCPQVVIFGRAIKRFPGLINTYYYDFTRYLKYSRTLTRNNREKIAAEIVATAHVVEKGMALPETRLGYGQPMVYSLIDLLKTHQANIPDFARQKALGVLKAYYDFHQEKDHDLGALGKSIESVFSINEAGESASDSTSIPCGGLITKSVADIKKAMAGNFETLAENRHSVRQFSDKPVDIEQIKHAIRLAQRSPSVCNRQGGRVYILQDKTLIEKALSLQNGNRGFGHQCQTLLLVACDLSIFDSAIERNQVYIDGGLFAMSLIYGLSSEQLASCCMNWCTTPKKDKNIRKIIKDFNSSHELLFMLAVGHYPENETVSMAQSLRRPLDEIITVIR